MMLDLQNLVSDDQDLAKAAAAYLSDFSINTGTAGTIPKDGTTVRKDLGRAKVEFLVQVTETFTSGGAATLTVELVMADNEALTTNLVVLQSTGAIALATLVAGYQFLIGAYIPVGTTKKYVGCRYTIGTATMTAGKVSAGVIKDRQTNGVGAS